MECLCGITWLIGSWFFLFFTSNTPIFTTYYRLNRVLVSLNLQVLQMIIDGEVWLFKSTTSSSIRSYKTNELTITGPFGFQGHCLLCAIYVTPSNSWIFERSANRIGFRERVVNIDTLIDHVWHESKAVAKKSTNVTSSSPQASDVWPLTIQTTRWAHAPPIHSIALPSFSRDSESYQPATNIKWL